MASKKSVAKSGKKPMAPKVSKKGVVMPKGKKKREDGAC